MPGWHADQYLLLVPDSLNSIVRARVKVEEEKQVQSWHLTTCTTAFMPTHMCHFLRMSRKALFFSFTNCSFFFSLGGASIIQCHILNDKRHILTKDTNNNVAYWDVLKVSVFEISGYGAMHPL